MMITNESPERSLLNVLQDYIEKSDKICFCVSFIVSSGLSLIIEKIRKSIKEKTVIQIITSTYLMVTHPAALQTLLNEQTRYPKNLEVKIYDVGFSHKIRSFHSKGYIFNFKEDQFQKKTPPRGASIIGSSNLSKNGLKEGIEWSFNISEDDLVSKSTQKFNELWDSDILISLSYEFLREYKVSFMKYHKNQLLFENQLENKLKSQSENNIENSIGINSQSSTISPTVIQKEAILSLSKLRQNGGSKGAIIAASGLGKTYLSAFDIKKQKPSTILFLAHRTDLLRQARDSYIRVLPAIESNSEIISEGRDISDKDFVFATVQSFTSKSKRFKQFAPNFFDYIVIDEFHHAAAKSYLQLINYYNPKFLLGLTATPERPDGKDVIEICDNNIVYRIDFHEAINKGFLSPFHYFGVAEDSNVDYSDFNWRKLRGNSKILEKEIFKRRIDYIIDKLDEYGFDGIKRKCIGFCASIKHAKFMEEQFKQVFGENIAVSITGEDKPDRRKMIYNRLENLDDSLKYIFAVDVLNEGIDIPSVNSILFLRPTTSSIVFLQQLGRGLRKNREKNFLTVLDFVGNDTVLEFTLNALNDPSKGKFDIHMGEVSPPDGCEVILEDKSLEILDKLKQRKDTRKTRMLTILYEMAKNLERPLKILDLLVFNDAPELWTIRSLFGSFEKAKKQVDEVLVFDTNDINTKDFDETIDLETRLENHKNKQDKKLLNYRKNFSEESRNFLILFEKNWQEKRIGAYGYLWGLLKTNSPKMAYNIFYKEFPEWNCEKDSQDNLKLLARLEKKLKNKNKNNQTIYYFSANDKNFTKNAWDLFNNPKFGEELKIEVRKRLLYYIRYYYRQRHQGVLRYPSDLLRDHFYSRPQIINHFQSQYDPQKHGKGIQSFNFVDKNIDEKKKKREIYHHIILITLKKGKDRSKRSHDYKDRFSDKYHLQWQGQNKWTEKTTKAKKLIHHSEKDGKVYLFIQFRSGDHYLYLGQLVYQSHFGEKPINFTWRLKTPLSWKNIHQLYGKKFTKSVKPTLNIDDFLENISEYV